MDRDLVLNPSEENVRDSQQPPFVKFHLDEIKSHFDTNVLEIESQFHIAESLLEHNRKEDAENIWRYQIVFLESAFDFYLHEVTKYGVGKIFDGLWNKTQKYCNIQVNMELIEDVLHGNVDEDWFAIFINKMYAKTTMVSFSSVKDQMNLIGIKIERIADEVFYDRDSNDKTIEKLKRNIDELYHRRNAIAHQADRKHENAEKNNINKEIVENFIEIFKKIVAAIHNEMISKKD